MIFFKKKGERDCKGKERGWKTEKTGEMEIREVKKTSRHSAWTWMLAAFVLIHAPSIYGASHSRH